MKITTIKFTDLRLSTRDGNKLRGYFGRLYQENSDLWHNHDKEGKNIYRYPLIQYKVVENVPMLVGINNGADLLNKMFLNISEIKIEGVTLPVHTKNIEFQHFKPSVNGSLHDYRFATGWVAVNQDNFESFKTASENERQNFLDRKLANNILSFYKGIGYWADNDIMVKCRVMEHFTNFKNRRMYSFKGSFTTNAILPDYVGIGKSVSRGYGTVING